MDVRRAAMAGRMASIALYCWMAVQLVLIFINADFIAGDGVNVWIATPDMVALWSGIAVLSLIPTAILLMIWVYRAMVVAHQVTPTLKITPGWAVGWFFVPVAWLWMPYEVVNEIAEGSGATRIAGTSALIGWWWAAWIGRGICGLFTWFGRSGGLSSHMLVFVMIGSAFAIASALLLQTVIARVTRVQAGAVDASIFA
jgi:hypothetical protein